MTDISPIELCPFNFKELNRLNRIVGNIEASLLLAKIKFHEHGTKLKKSGLPAIARTRDEIKSWYGFSQRKTDTLLSTLSEKGLLSKVVGSFYGKKKLFLTTSEKVNTTPINLKLLSVLIEETGSLKAALVYSRIAFAFNGITCTHEGIDYCFMKKEKLCDFAEISVRTLDKIVEKLVRKGLLLKKTLISNNKRQMHFHIPTHAMLVFKRRFEELQKDAHTSQGVAMAVDNPGGKEGPNCKICREEPAKMQSSIRIRTDFKKANNNTVDKDQEERVQPQPQAEGRSDIIFSEKKEEEEAISITPRQLRYVEGALKNTMARHQVTVTNPQSLLAQLIYSLTSKEQQKGIHSFKHAVSRFMKIIASGNWRTPIGFYKHSEQGRAAKAEYLAQMREHQARKETEINKAKPPLKESLGNSPARVSENSQLMESAWYTAKLLKQAVHQYEKSQDERLINVIDRHKASLLAYFKEGIDPSEIRAFLLSE